MNVDQAIALAFQLFRTTLFVAGPILAAALVAGILVGIIQTATQINEASISFLVKVGAVVAVSLALGPQLASYVIDYTRASFESISQVVH
jgi:flagellar biosynthetic protein FliQ